MPKGPKGEKRKADVIGNAVLVMRIATGQVEDRPATPAGSSRGGKARAAKMSVEARKEAAKVAAQARWRKKAEV